MQFPHALSSSGTIFMSKTLRERKREREGGTEGDRQVQRGRQADK